VSNRTALKVLRAHVQAKADLVLDAALLWEESHGEQELRDLEADIARYREARALLDAAEAPHDHRDGGEP
jgi:hypothetical protein